jgi:hypothetical protein
MSIAVEVNLKIPGLTIRAADQPVKVINNSAVRFARLIDVPAIPKPGASIEVPVGAGVNFGCTVTRAEWHEEREIFIVSCQYAKTRISPDDYNALINNADWTQKLLGA